jgi:hypothetical protein
MTFGETLGTVAFLLACLSLWLRQRDKGRRLLCVLSVKRARVLGVYLPERRHTKHRDIAQACVTVTNSGHVPVAPISATVEASRWRLLWRRLGSAHTEGTGLGPSAVLGPTESVSFYGEIDRLLSKLKSHERLWLRAVVADSTGKKHRSKRICCRPSELLEGEPGEG